MFEMESGTDSAKATVALTAYASTISVCYAAVFYFGYDFWPHYILMTVVSLIVLKRTLSPFDFQIAIRSIFLGVFLSGSFVLFKHFTYPYTLFGYHMIVLSLFHFAEFFILAISNPSEAKPGSFIIRHSVQYHCAMLLTWTEFFIECYFVPNSKRYMALSLFGLVCCLIGDFIRKLAIWTAKTNFKHIIQTRKSHECFLVTDGIYGFFRHPSYLGFLILSSATQVLLQNPICFLTHTITVWIFTISRIMYEEKYLISFFGLSYEQYQKQVPTGIPFCKGYLQDD